MNSLQNNTLTAFDFCRNKSEYNFELMKPIVNTRQSDLLRETCIECTL